MRKLENVIGFFVLVLILIFGKLFLGKEILFFRLIVGMGLGYTLTRGYMGFAGSVNRLYRTGSTKLLRVLMWMFSATAVISIAFLYNIDASSYDLWINQINLGLILGGLLFGFGMTFSACCASGVLTDLVTGLPRALVTLLFFGLGVFIGFPVQSSASWVKKSWITSEVGEKLYKGVYLPDLFKWDGLDGYLGASLLTLLFAGIVVYFAKKYESNRRLSGMYKDIESEKEQYKNSVENHEKFKLFSRETYYTTFAKPWRMGTAAAVIVGLFTLLMGITKAGWGASTPYGFWFGKFLKIFGASTDFLVAFTGKPAKVFDMPFLSHPITVQNIGIIIGTIICLLLAGNFKKVFLSEMKITLKDTLLFAMGGFCMGFGTRLSNGCNVGALYTPIANFSLSGWIYLIFLVTGGVIGNKVRGGKTNKS